MCLHLTDGRDGPAGAASLETHLQGGRKSKLGVRLQMPAPESGGGETPLLRRPALHQLAVAKAARALDSPEGLCCRTATHLPPRRGGMGFPATFVLQIEVLRSRSSGELRNGET